jgi:hypothetical protein
MPAFVRSVTIVEKQKTNARTTIAMQALLIGTKRKRITGIKRTNTARKTAISRATKLMRAIEKNSIVESSVSRCCFPGLKNLYWKRNVLSAI